MDGELRVQVRGKNYGVDQDSDWRRAVGADFHYDDQAVFSDPGGGRKFLPAARRVGYRTRRYVTLTLYIIEF